MFFICYNFSWFFFQFHTQIVANWLVAAAAATMKIKQNQSIYFRVIYLNQHQDRWLWKLNIKHVTFMWILFFIISFTILLSAQSMPKLNCSISLRSFGIFFCWFQKIFFYRFCLLSTFKLSFFSWFLVKMLLMWLHGMTIKILFMVKLKFYYLFSFIRG